MGMFLLAFGSPLLATDVGGSIDTNTTWNLAASPYVATGGIVIEDDATLTIEPGVVVRFNPITGIVVGSGDGDGTLVARGTEESPIIFTSVKDPGDPCDPAGPGDWTRIYFTDHAVDANVVRDGNDVNYISGCILEHVVVEYAGDCFQDHYGAIDSINSTPFINNCEIRHNYQEGICHRCSIGPGEPGAPPPIHILNCDIWDNGSGCLCPLPSGRSDCARGIYIRGGWEHYIKGNNIHENPYGGIYVYGAGAYMFIYEPPFYIYLDSLTFTGNTVSDNGGPGDLSHPGVKFEDCLGGVTLTENIINGNMASSGNGGVVIWSYDGDCYPTLIDNVITGNNASGSRGGGGIFLCHILADIPGIPSDSHLTGNTISGNNTNGHGGGVLVEASSNITFTGNTITNNTANGSGGGISLTHYPLSYCGGLTLIGNTIENNTAAGEGGGIHFNNCDNSNLAMNTITNNHSTGGECGGIYVTNGSEWLSLAGDPCEGTYNTIWGNDGNQVYNGNAVYYDDKRNDINAVYLQWATCDANEIEAGIFDRDDDSTKARVDYDPFVCPGALSNTCWDPGECAGQPDGDASCDGNVNLADLFALKADFGKCAPWAAPECCCDFDQSGCINLADLFTLKAGFGTSGYSPSTTNQNCPP
jgi:parallel beta-helix repeat protein